MRPLLGELAGVGEDDVHLGEAPFEAGQLIRELGPAHVLQPVQPRVELLVALEHVLEVIPPAQQEVPSPQAVEILHVGAVRDHGELVPRTAPKTLS